MGEATGTRVTLEFWGFGISEVHPPDSGGLCELPGNQSSAGH